jgi:hypothetical protein
MQNQCLGYIFILNHGFGFYVKDYVMLIIVKIPDNYLEFLTVLAPMATEGTLALIPVTGRVFVHYPLVSADAL